MVYSQKIANGIIYFLEDLEVDYSFDRENGILQFRAEMNCKLKKCRIYIVIRDSWYSVKARLNIKVHKKYMPAVAEYFCRVNYQMSFGCFVMDYETGGLNFQLAVDCEDCMLSKEVIQDSIKFPLQALEKYGNGLLKVIEGVVTPEQAIVEMKAR